MKRDLFRMALVVGILVCGFLFGLYAGRNAHRMPIESSVDTLSILKEMVDSDAILTARMPKGYELVPVGTVDSLARLAERPKRVREVEKPVLVVKDSTVYIHVPMQQYVFAGRKDSVDYKVKSTGYNVSLDEISFRYPETVVTRLERVDMTRKVGFGLAVGPSMLVTPAGKVYGGIGGSAGLYIRF